MENTIGKQQLLTNFFTYHPQGGALYDSNGQLVALNKAISEKLAVTEMSDFLYFYVSDTGQGIPENELEHIFGRFVQLKGSQNGIRLGLAICKGLVNKMGGEISVSSRLGEGSTFQFTLPLPNVLS